MFNDWIPAGGNGYARDGKILRLSVPQWKDASATDAPDILKVFASTAPIMASKFVLDLPLAPEENETMRKLVVDAGETDVSFWGTSVLAVITPR